MNDSTYRQRIQRRRQLRYGIPPRENPTREEFLDVLRDGTVEEIAMALHDTHGRSRSPERGLMERVCYANADIFNGGVLQYLDNKPGEASLLAGELAELGLHEHAESIHRAAKRYADAERSTLDDASFEDIDALWFGSSAKFEACLMAYVRRHAEALFGD